MMYPPGEQLKRLTDDCTVRIPAGDVAGGSGFFVAQGTVVSCAHVVANETGHGTADRATIVWKNASFTGQVRATPKERGTAALWHYPDLCVIDLDSPPKDHPVVSLGDTDGAGGAELYLTGFTAVYDPGTPRFQGRSGRLDGPQDLEGGRGWQVANCEMAEGMSGGPVLELRSGYVWAVTKTRRMKDTDMGGLVIPATAIRDAFAEVWEKNQWESARNDQWRRLQDALPDMDGLPSREERESLIRTAAQLNLKPEDLSALWRKIVTDLGPELPRRLEDMADLIHALADLPRRPLDPCVKLFLLLAAWGQAEWRDDLRRRGERLARQRGQANDFGTYYAPDLSGRARDAQPVIVIRLEPFGPDQLKEVLLTIWRYSGEDGLPRQVKCDPGPHSVRVIEKTITDVLASEIPETSQGKKPMIEFALPDHLLDHAVETWRVDGWPLGVDYPVVIRFTNRTSAEAQAWRSWKAQFRSGQLPPRNTTSWNNLWIVCGDNRGRDQLNGMLQGADSLPLLALTAWHRGKKVPPAVTAARHAGASVIVWQHKPCADHTASALNGSAAVCRGRRFQEAITEDLSGVKFDELPEKVRQLRARTTGQREDPGQNIAILWDDPSRLPWTDAPRNQAPR